jgi:hypothetical protein
MLRRNDFLPCKRANLVASLVHDIDRVSHFRAILAFCLRNIGRLDDVNGVFGVNDGNAIGLDQRSKLIVYLAGVFLRYALRSRQGDCGLGLHA